MKILIIDDDEALLVALGRLLEESKDLDVSTAGSAELGVAMVGESDYDFVLVDFKMPKHDGVWFMQNAKIPRATKVLLMTAFVNRDVINEMFSLGIVGYLIKPFGEEELMRHLSFHSSGSVSPEL